MNKRKGIFTTLIILTLAILAGYKFFFTGNKQPTAEQKDAPLLVSNSSDSFTNSLNAGISHYLLMKDALVKDDTATANREAASFALVMDSLSVQELKADSIIKMLTNELRTKIAENSKLVMQVPEIEAKRRAFQSTSDHLFDLLRTVQYNGATIYQLYCPMAFNNTGANWLSMETEIMNPYFGEKMLHCGEVKDSIYFNR